MLEFVLGMRPALPMSREKPCSLASNSEVRRWLRDASVIVNDKKPKPDELIEFPVTRLVFFPKSKANRCTLL